MMTNKNKRRSDFILAVVAICLSLFGVVMIYSAGVVMAEKYFDSTTYFVTRQMVSLVIGAFGLILASQINFSVWRKYSYWLFLLSVLLLIPISIHWVHPVGGAYRWYQIGSISFQPSELLKLTFIFYLAALFEKKGNTIRSFAYSTVPFFIVLILVAVLIMREPDLGSLAVLAMIAMTMYFVSGSNLAHIVVIGIVLAAVAMLFIKAAPYRLARVESFINPAKDTQGIGYHNNQALIAIGTGGLLGKGFGQSIQKHFYLPEPHTDSIFAVMVEELGFIRSSIIMLAFLIIIWRGYVIARETTDYFGKLVVVGVISWIIFQAYINIAAMLRIIPLTGIPIPFISYGGSSLMILLFAVGIVLNISKNKT